MHDATTIDATGSAEPAEPGGRHRRRARSRGERGIAVMLTGLLLIPLLVFAAFGVDLASWYARISALQRGADAAALAGAVWMPTETTACDRAADSLRSNDLDPDRLDIDWTCAQGASSTALRVSVTDLQADRYFSSIFVQGPAELTRYAEAEYNLPLPLGSPLHYFGGDISKVPDPPPDYSYDIIWPADLSTRAPFDNAAALPPSVSDPVFPPHLDCHITNDPNLLGRWAGSPATYRPTQYGSGPVCGWSVSPGVGSGTSASPPPDYWVRRPVSIPNPNGCRVRQDGNASGTIYGRWIPGTGGDSRPRFSVSGGSVNVPTCSWGNVTTDSSLFASHPSGANVVRTIRPQNYPCRVGYTNADGYWPASGVWTAGAPPFAGDRDTDGNRLCTWSAVTDETTVDPGPPIDANRSPGFWAQIHGPGGDSNSGDGVNTRCLTQLNTNPCALASVNPDYRQPTDPNQGIWYVIKAPPGGGSVTVSIFDAQHTSGGLNVGTGDSTIGGSGTAAFSTTYRMYQQTNPLDFNVRTELGSDTPDTADNSCHWSVNDEAAFRFEWAPLCTINMAADSIYLLNVRTAERAGFSNSAGRNGYAVQACSNGNCDAVSQPAIYAYERMVLYNNVASGDATFYLAEVGPQYAGRTLVVEMWDPGEASGQAWVYPRQPSATFVGAVDPVSPASCEVTSTRSGYPRVSDLNNGGQCSYRSADGGSLYNGHTVTMRIQIPASYTCTAGLNPVTTAGSCWWGIRYTFSAAATDTTTWWARIEGNPLQLTQ